MKKGDFSPQNQLRLRFITLCKASTALIGMVFLLEQVLQSQGTDLNAILQAVYSFAFIIYLIYAQRIQTLQMLRQIEVTLRKVKHLKEEARNQTIKTLVEIGKPIGDIAPRVDRFIDFFSIGLESMDPAGIVDKMDHFLKTNKHIYESEVKALAPNATPVERNNLENLVEVSQALNIYYKVIRHYYLLGKKTMNIYVIMQVHMILPQLLQMVEAYSSGIQAFQEGMPIGDGVGPIVAAKLMHGYPQTDVAEEIVAAEVPYEGRTLVVFKAKGPGGSVGNPDEGLINILKARKGKVKIIITIDAAGKLEGEPVGQVSEGIGAAIGGSGKEKFKMEEITTKYKIPMHAVAIKQGMEHVVAPLVETLFDATDKAVEAVKRIIMDYTEPGDVVVIAGIGNTIGVGQ